MRKKFIQWDFSVFSCAHITFWNRLRLSNSCHARNMHHTACVMKIVKVTIFISWHFDLPCEWSRPWRAALLGRPWVQPCPTSSSPRSAPWRGCRPGSARTWPSRTSWRGRSWSWTEEASAAKTGTETTEERDLQAWFRGFTALVCGADTRVRRS